MNKTADPQALRIPQRNSLILMIAGYLIIFENDKY